MIPAVGPYRGALSSPTKVLLHFDGVNGTQVFTDSAPIPNTWTPSSGTAVLSTALAVLGSASLTLPNAGDGLGSPFPSTLSLAGEFTIVFRWTAPAIYPGGGSYRFITCATGIAGDPLMALFIESSILQWYTGIYSVSDTRIQFTDFSFVAGTTYAIAISRDAAGVIRAAVDGVVSAVTGTNLSNFTKSGTPLYLGIFVLSAGAPIYCMDELLISEDCLFTANYTVQTTEFDPASIPPFT